MELMEEGGWLAELQARIAPGISAPRPQNMLAVTDSRFDLAKAAAIQEKLEALIDRVSDGIDES